MNREEVIIKLKEIIIKTMELSVELEQIKERILLRK